MRRRGFTLLEVLIATIICALLFGILSAAILESRSIFQTSDILATLQAGTRLAILRMTSDLRRTSISQINIIQNSPIVNTDTITYSLPLDVDLDGIPDDLTRSTPNFWDSNIVTISFDPTTNSLLKSAGGNIVVLASNVKRINFLDYTLDTSLSMDELKIILDLEKATYKGRIYNKNSTSIVSTRN